MELRAGGEGSHIDILIRLECFVYRDLLVVDDRVAEHSALLFRCGRTVQSGCDQDRNVRIRIAFADLLKFERKGDLAGNSTRVIACDDDDFVLSFCKFAKRGSSDRILQSFFYKLDFAFVGLEFMHLGCDDRLEVFLIHMNIKRRGVIRNCDSFFHDTRYLL